jgi:hypothetical protein
MYGTGGKDFQLWHSLWQYLMDWDREQPSSLKPLNNRIPGHTVPLDAEGRSPDFDDDNNTDIFLHMYCASDCSAASQQYFQLSRLLLVACDPRSLLLGVGSVEFQRKRNDQIRDAVRVICCISEANKEYQPSMSIANLAIALGGELFSDPRETKELLRIVRNAEQHLRWPGFVVSNKLQKFWNL